MHECTDRETLIYARDEIREALNSLATVFVFSRALVCHIRVAQEFHEVTNKKHARVMHASVKFKSSGTVYACVKYICKISKLKPRPKEY